jgi:hypothetical protein
MKIAEALVKRTELKKRIADAQSRVLGVTYRIKGEERDPELPGAMREWHSISNQIAQLTLALNRSNVGVGLTWDNRTLTIAEALCVREQLDREAEFWGQVLSYLGRARTPDFTPSLDRREVMAKKDKATKDRHDLDMAIQQANWSNDLLS